MTGTNHALTGGVIGLAIGGPIAIPVAFASHFALDAMPHFGIEIDDRLKNRKFFLRAMTIDGVLLLAGLFVSLLFSIPWYVYASMIAAMSPDFIWIYRYVVEEKMGLNEPKPMNAFNRWHANIQTMETVHGVWFEILWFILMSVLAINLV